jgi:hypothetical protein
MGFFTSFEKLHINFNDFKEILSDHSIVAITNSKGVIIYVKI